MKQKIYGTLLVVALFVATIFGFTIHNHNAQAEIAASYTIGQMTKTILPRAVSSSPDTTVKTPVAPTQDDYTNAKDGWRISFPGTFTLQTNQDLSLFSLPTGTKFTYPESWSTGTNLSEGYVAIGVKPYVSVEKCFPNNGSETINTTKLTLNNLTFYKATSTDAGAGNLYETETYVTIAHNKCYVLSTLLHSTNRGNYPPSLRPKAFDKQQFITAFEDMVKNFSLFQ